MGVWTSTQQKNVDDFFRSLLERMGLERGQFILISTQDYSSRIAREGYHGDGNHFLFLKPLNSV